MSPPERELHAPGDLAPTWHPSFNPWLIAFTVMLVTFMEVLDTSIAVVSLPHISGNLSAGIDESTWVLTSYLVSNAIVLPLSGWFSSLFGRKRFFMACVGVFMASSLLCGLAPTLPWLVVFRILQGAGGGSMQPIAQAILAESFPPHRRGMAMAVYAMGVVVAPIVGPTVGGWITDNYSWRWIFFINVPVGMISLLMASWVIQDPPYLVRRTFRTGLRIDYIGLALLSVGLGALQIVLDKGQREDWMESNFILILTVITAASLVALVFWELRQSQPVVELHLLKGRNFAVSTFTMFALGFVLYGSTALLPIFLQTMLGYTAMLSGLVLSPGGLATMIALPLVGRLLGRFEPRWLVVIGVVAVVASLVQMSHFNLQVDFATAAWARVLQGVGLAFLFVPVNTMAFQPLARHQMNYASGLINLARNIGGSCGIAFVTTVLARAAQVHQNHLVGNLSPLNVGYRNALDGATAALTAAGSGPVEAAQQAQGLLYGGLIRESTMLAFVDNFRMLAILFAFIVPLMFLMKKISPSKGPTLAH